MDNAPEGMHSKDGDKPRVDKGGDKPGPYPVRVGWQSQPSSRSRVGAGLVPALATILFIVCSSVVLLLISSPQKALAQGNTFIVTMLGSAQQPGFAPDLLTVHTYDTVVFMNSAAAPIAITATDSSFSSPTIAPGKQWKITFNSVGAFEYHDNSNPTPHTFGEIVVVPNSVPLLPSPAPAAQQTAIAYIQAGKTPPDTVWQQAPSSVQTPTVVSPSQNQTTHPPLTLLIPFARPVILVVIVLFALFAVGLGGLWFHRRLQSRKKENDDEDDEDDEDE